ncbi:MAG TPA: GatB/YqeY domain-containing protein [Candidatus Paceibacterota bacterium]|nr:GatB/YqeY domain-containing protein [Candidatus Paceibacterota bacterium]
MLKDTLKDDMKAAMKSGDARAKSTIAMLLSAVKNRELDKRSKLAKAGTPDAELDASSALTDEEVVEVIGSEIKKRKESIATFEQAGRAELAEGEKAEMEVLVKYLPEQMGEDEVRKLVTEAVAETGAATPKDMGKVMAKVSPKTKGRFDGSRLAELVKESLMAK